MHSSLLLCWQLFHWLWRLWLWTFLVFTRITLPLSVTATVAQEQEQELGETGIGTGVADRTRADTRDFGRERQLKKSKKSKSSKSSKNHTPRPWTTAPTNAPTNAPTGAPTKVPTNAPTDSPTDVPTDAPTNAPTNVPQTSSPTASDSASSKSSPYAITYSPATDTPNTDDYAELSSATQGYLEDAMKEIFNKIALTDLDNFLTIMVGVVVSQGKSVVVTYESNGLLNPDSLFIPVTQEIDDLIQGMIGSVDYLALVKSLPASNPFQKTEKIS